MLKIAIQSKGRLNERSLSLLEEAGITLPQSRRGLVSTAADFPLQALFLRDDDIPSAVASGVADLGIVGLNMVEERGLTLQTVMPLGFGRCRLSLAVPAAADYDGARWLSGRTIATSYPNILRRYLLEQGVQACIRQIEGSVEIAPAVGMADAIFDIVQSGSTLVSNGLREVATVLECQAVLIAAKELSQEKRRLLDMLRFRFNSINESRGKKYVLMNIPCQSVPEAAAIIPGLRAPTVVPLSQTGWCSLQAVIDASDLWDSVESLKGLGAEGVLVMDLENIIK